jgi:hypothetical protein
VLFVLALSVLTASPDDCREAYAAVNYKEAARVCVEVLSEAPRGELPGLYRLAGLSLAAVGEDERAYGLFVSLLAMDPQVQLDPALSPRLRAPFEKAKQARGGEALKLGAKTAPAKLREGKPFAVDVEVRDGAGRPVTELQLKRDGKSQAAARADPTHFELGAATPGKLTLELTALDKYGGRLAALPFELDVAAVQPRGGLLSWKLWAVAAAVVLVGATVSGVLSGQFFDAAKKERYASDAASKLALSNGLGIGADVGFGVGGAMGLAALLLLITDERE